MLRIAIRGRWHVTRHFSPYRAEMQDELASTAGNSAATARLALQNAYIAGDVR
jgi:hypothetical protein